MILAAWNMFMLWIGPISLAMFIRVRFHEARERRILSERKEICGATRWRLPRRWADTYRLRALNV